MVQLKGQLQLSDYKAAQRLHAGRDWLSGWTRYWVIGILVLIVIGIVIVNLLHLSDWTFLLVIAVAGSVGVLLGVLRRPDQMARLFAQQKELSMPFEMEFGDEAVHFRNEYGNSRLPWQVFIKWKEDGEIFLLYRSDILVNIVPKHLFQNENDVEYVRERLRAHAVPDATTGQIRLAPVVLAASTNRNRWYFLGLAVAVILCFITVIIPAWGLIVSLVVSIISQFFGQPGGMQQR